MSSACLIEKYFDSIPSFVCFLPLECCCEKRKRNIQYILESGLKTILQIGQKESSSDFFHKNFSKNKLLSQKIQDQVDPYLSLFYNYYSLANGLTKPFLPFDGIFCLDPKFIPEGENDCARVELYKSIVNIYVWKSFVKKICNLHIRYKVKWLIMMMINQDSHFF